MSRSAPKRKIALANVNRLSTVLLPAGAVASAQVCVRIGSKIASSATVAGPITRVIPAPML
ncbi:MAG: hypothetical protein V3T28_00920 [Gemmatimonadales bacterium]